MTPPLLSIDSNILLYSLNTACPEFVAARAFLETAVALPAVISELVLVELYLLLRNPAVLRSPYAASNAAAVCQVFRRIPKWRLVDGASVMDEVWDRAGSTAFPRRRIIDARLALSLRHHGVQRFATRNLRDFKDFGFQSVFDPLAA